jgi:tyrosyl-tRNA synthetase
MTANVNWTERKIRELPAYDETHDHIRSAFYRLAIAVVRLLHSARALSSAYNFRGATFTRRSLNRERSRQFSARPILDGRVSA